MNDGIDGALGAQGAPEGAGGNQVAERAKFGTASGTPWRDAFLVLVLTVASAIACSIWNVSELLRRWSAPWERFQLDELPAVLIVLASGLVWFAYRRYRESHHEVRRRQIVENELRGALSDNRRLAQRYALVREEERKALARELHDELGQSLLVIRMDAAGIRDGDPAMERACAIIDNSNRIHGVITGLLRQLRPVGLDQLGLAAALEHCVVQWRERLPDTCIDLSVAEGFTDPSEDIAIGAFRLVQEALTNAAKHASARHVSVRLSHLRHPGRGDLLVVSVEDDGVGADVSVYSRGLGLVGMRERIEALGGEFELASAPGEGFRVTASLPQAAVDDVAQHRD